MRGVLFAVTCALGVSAGAMATRATGAEPRGPAVLGRPVPGPSRADQDPLHVDAAEQSQTSDDQAGTRAVPFIIEVPPTRASQEAAIKADRREDAAASREGWLVGFTGILTVATALLGGATCWLAVSTKRLWRSTDVAIEDARKSSERELRAYIAVAPMGVAQLIGRKDAIGQVELRNVGRLPARRVFLTVHMEIDKRIRNSFPVPDDDPAERAVQPGADMHQGSKKYIAIPSIVSAKPEDELHVFVWGIVHYDDGYDCRRFTRFCHRYNVASHNRGVDWKLAAKKTRLVIDADKARYHTYGNDAD